MNRQTRLAFGILVPCLFLCGILVLGLAVPEYSSVRQTVSEIGEVGSPVRLPFTMVLCGVGLCLAIFSSGLRDLCRVHGRSTVAAWLVLCMGISSAGAGIFSFPHPLHNVFGTSEIIGYQAPLAVAITWRGEATGSIARFSGWMYIVVLLTIAANCSVFDTHGAMWHFERPFYGLVQRSLFAAWFLWCAGLAVLLRGIPTEATPSLPPLH